MGLRTDRLWSKRFWWRALLSLATLALLVVCVAVGGFWYLLDGSLPQLDGTVAVAASRDGWGAHASEASIVRDSLGHVTIEARTRSDAAFATGYAHAQDRFFQMDLLRRVAAGELAALFGAQAVRVDEQNRMHRFRARAREVVNALPADQRALLETYTAGVNAGLASLRVRPFEYCVLRVKPQPWRAEDSILALYAMYLDLQSGEMRQIASRGVLAQQMSPALSEFLLQTASHWDAPLDRAVPANIHVSDNVTSLAIPAERPDWLDAPTEDSHSLLGARADDIDWRSAIGSNSFAVAGPRAAAGGAALVANDTHLGLNLPNIWYRLAIHVTASNGGASLRIAGVSLPGAPLIVVGSNGDVAWGFTNSYGHYIDLVEVETDPAHPARYRSPPETSSAQSAHEAVQAQRRPFARRDADASASAATPPASNPSAWRTASAYRETIEVHGAAPVSIIVYETQWGPEWRVAGHVFAVHWVAHDPRAANLTLGDMEQAHDVTSAMRVAQRSGVPTQNIVIADRSGHIGWTLAGPLPNRASSVAAAGAAQGASANVTANTTESAAETTAQNKAQNTPALTADDATESATQTSLASPAGMTLPVPADRYVGWHGYLDPAAYPVRIDPTIGALWTANNRQLDSAEQSKIGDGGADVGARATQIRDDLAAHDVFDERGLLAIQLDDRARALAFWRTVMLEALDTRSLAGHPDRQALRALVSEWDARADVDSVGYTLVRDFQTAMYQGWFGALDARMSGLYAGTGYRAASSRSLAVMEALASAHAWVPKRFASWQAFVLNRVDAVIARDTADGAVLDRARWGDRNRAAIAHPFARLMPGWIATHLSAPPDRLPGDINMPRVQGRGFGASERMVVAPGHEDQGILEMPGGASGHPLSPFFLAGHEDWVQGQASAFLPGPEAHRLRLVPN